MKIDRSKLGTLARYAARHWFYVLCAAFFFYVVFLSEYNLIRLWSLQSQEAELRKEIHQYQDSIANFQRRIDEVDTNVAELERYARERLLLHGENEDLYLIEK